MQVHVPDGDTQSEEHKALRALFLQAYFENNVPRSGIGMDQTLWLETGRRPLDYGLSAGGEMAVEGGGNDVGGRPRGRRWRSCFLGRHGGGGGGYLLPPKRIISVDNYYGQTYYYRNLSPLLLG